MSAFDQSLATPAFSNRDTTYNDVAAPGVGIVSTYPFDLTDPACAWPGYNFCARAQYAHHASGAGTSFAAPLVSAAAALLLAQRPTLTASQVMTLLELSAADMGTPGRDAASGYGRLDLPERWAPRSPYRPHLTGTRRMTTRARRRGRCTAHATW